MPPTVNLGARRRLVPPAARVLAAILLVGVQSASAQAPRRPAAAAPSPATSAQPAPPAAPLAQPAQIAPSPDPHGTAGPAGTPAPGAPQNRQVTLLGLGMATCEAWGQLHQLGTGETADQWLMGYLSGTAVVAGSNYLSGLAPADLLRRVQEYCKANPRAVLGVAGIEVAKEIRTAAEGKPAGEVAPALPSPAASTPAKPPAR